MTDKEKITNWSNKKKRYSYIIDSENYQTIEETRSTSLKLERLIGTPFVRVRLKVMHHPSTFDMFVTPRYYQTVAYRRLYEPKGMVMPFDVQQNSIETWMAQQVQKLRSKK